jgi:hypothetical protein
LIAVEIVRKNPDQVGFAVSGVARAYDTPQDRLSGFFLGFDLDDEINVVSDGA